jgi:ABC-type phosphate transport system substrate-binding protein
MRRALKIPRLVLFLGLTGGCCAAMAQDIVVVVNPETRISSISVDDLRAIFTGARSKTTAGLRLVPVTLKGGPAHEVFLNNYLDETPDEYRTAWRKAVFTGQGAMPMSFDSETALLDFVANTPGALGYASRIPQEGRVKLVVVLNKVR